MRQFPEASRHICRSEPKGRDIFPSLTAFDSHGNISLTVSVSSLEDRYEIGRKTRNVSVVRRGWIVIGVARCLDGIERTEGDNKEGKGLTRTCYEWHF